MGNALRILTTVVLATILACLAQAEEPWPSKPIHIVVPFPAGGQLDVVTRIIAERISPALGQPIIIDVKPGADGNIGTELAAKSAADGYTWLAASPPTTIQPSVRPKTLRYDPSRDFRAVSFLGTSPFLFVVPASLPVATLKEFIAYAKARPGQLSYAGSSRGTVVHLSTEILKRDVGIAMEMINYTGQPSAIPDLLTGRVQFMALGLVLAEPYLKAGKLKALAVLDAERHSHLPDVPSVFELGYPNLVMSTWFGVVVPKQTPTPIVERINAEISKALGTPDIIQKFRDLGIDPAKPDGPQGFERFLAGDLARWKKVAQEANINLD